MITLEEQIQYLQKRFKLLQEQIDAVSSIASQAFDRATDALNRVKEVEEADFDAPANAGEERD